MKHFSILSVFKAFALLSLFTLSACGGGGSGGGTISISGILSNPDGVAVSGATVTSRKADGDTVVDTATTSADGSYTVKAPKNEKFYLNSSATTYVPSNTFIVSFADDQTGADIVIIDEANSSTLVNLFDGSADWNAAKSNAWVALDFYYGDENDGESITATSTPIVNLLYNQCDGTFDLGPTPSPACADRMGPMAMGKSSVNENVEFVVSGTGASTASTVNGGTMKVEIPLRPGEISYAEVWIDDVPVVDTSVTVNVSGSVEDADSGTMLAGVVVQARSPYDDSVFVSGTTDSSGAYSLAVPANTDFYLHATGQPDNKGTFQLGSEFYVSGNLQIENEAADRSGLKFYLPTATLLGTIGPSVGINTGNDAMFAMDIEDASSAGITGVSVSADPAVTNIFYNQPGGGGLLSTGPSTTQNSPSVLGYIVNPGANSTQTFTLTPDQSSAGYTIDSSFKLRLIPGELSQPIEP